MTCYDPFGPKDSISVSGVEDKRSTNLYLPLATSISEISVLMTKYDTGIWRLHWTVFGVFHAKLQIPGSFQVHGTIPCKASHTNG